uniref:Uncharacterized protein n=1 Tax=Triticum urartu TaxID=4572 RepID=A0A8R7UU91_TRIUA
MDQERRWRARQWVRRQQRPPWEPPEISPWIQCAACRSSSRGPSPAPPFMMRGARSKAGQPTG